MMMLMFVTLIYRSYVVHPTHQSSLHLDSSSLDYKPMISRDFSPTKTTYLTKESSSQDEAKMANDLHVGDGVGRTNSPPSSHIARNSSHDFYGEVEHTMKIHTDSLLQPQDSVSDTLFCPHPQYLSTLPR